MYDGQSFADLISVEKGEKLGGTEYTVLTKDGVPIPKAVIRVRQRDGIRGTEADYYGFRVETNEDGVAVVEGLEATGIYLLRVHPPDSSEDLLEWEKEDWTPRDEVVRLAPNR